MSKAIYNHLATFGLEVSAPTLGFLLSKDPKKIIIATNNDVDKSENRGKIAAIKNMMKLSTVFPVDMLEIKMPSLNDLSDMHAQDLSLKEWLETENTESPENIRQFMDSNYSKFNGPKTKKFLNKL